MLIPHESAEKLYRRRYAINFDLSIEKLENYYSTTNPKGAYGEINKFMQDNGFAHRQYSGYVSVETMTKRELFDFVERLNEKFQWLGKCIEKMDATVIPKTYDLKEMINDLSRENHKTTDLQLDDYIDEYQ